MIDSLPVPRAVPEAPAGRSIAGLGDPGARLLAGPAVGAETLAAHVARLGPLSPPAGLADLWQMVAASGLRGRGGGGFPSARKLEAARLAPGEPVVIVNVAESEPASRKDHVLGSCRPHLVLDGAVAVAALVGATEVVVHAHRSKTGGGVLRAVDRAIGERRRAGLAEPRWLLSAGPDGYVSGEASAVASFVDGGVARPRFSGNRMATEGPSGRPTVVLNAETVAHLGYLAHVGLDGWWAPDAPDGPRLVTLAGAVSVEGLVLEVSGWATLGDILQQAGWSVPPAAVLVGGYSGTWIDGPTAWSTRFDRPGLHGVGGRPGCGLVAVLPHGACGLAETARLARYLAGQSAGQCGPCVQGLAGVADGIEALVAGRLRRRGLHRLEVLSSSVVGRGACSHPDGVAHLVASALRVFAADAAHHLTGRTCEGTGHPPAFAVPTDRPTPVTWR